MLVQCRESIAHRASNRRRLDKRKTFKATAIDSFSSIKRPQSVGIRRPSPVYEGAFIRVTWAWFLQNEVPERAKRREKGTCSVADGLTAAAEGHRGLGGGALRRSRTDVDVVVVDAARRRLVRGRRLQIFEEKQNGRNLQDHGIAEFRFQVFPGNGETKRVQYFYKIFEGISIQLANDS